MKLPRNISGAEIVRGLKRVGYVETRQTGDHVYMTTEVNGEHHVSVPQHKPVKVGTLATILSAVAGHLQMERAKLLRAMKI
jgi:predicted RNA binding protein YcfA (HicA-like mRNA interferase family)